MKQYTEPAVQVGLYLILINICADIISQYYYSEEKMNNIKRIALLCVIILAIPMDGFLEITEEKPALTLMLVA